MLPRRYLSLGIVLLSTAAARTQAPTDRLPPEVQNWTSGFTGRVRTWRCHWTIEANGQPVPFSHTVYLTEYRFARGGREHVTLSWRSPFRHDLTPDFECTQHTQEHTVLVRGDDHTGARAVLSAPTPAGKQGSGWETYLADPLVGLATPIQAEALVGLDWVEGGPGKREQGWFDVGRPVPGPGPDGIPVSYWVGATPEKQPGLEKVRAHLAVREGARTADMKKGQLPGAADLAALDLHTDVTKVNPGWEGTIDASYRVLQWQPVPPVGGRAPAGVGIPKLAIWEVKSLTPKLPGRNYHRRAVVLIDIEPDPGLSLSNIEQMLPGEKLVDLRTNRAWVGAPVGRDECVAWSFLTDASSKSDSFRNLLDTDLRAAHPTSFKPLSTFIVSKPSGSPVGTLINGLPFKPVTFPVVDPEGLLITLQSVQFGTPWNTAGSLLATSPPESAQTPALLRVLSQIRSAGQTTDPRSYQTPERVGYQPVPPEQQVRANLVLGFIFYGLVIAAGAVLVACVRVRRRAGPRPRGAEPARQTTAWVSRDAVR